MNCVIVLGNGFDLNLGWNTSCEAFYKKLDEWKTFKTSEHDLFQYVIDKTPDNWYDFERTLHEYTLYRAVNPASKEMVQRDIQDYNTLKSFLMSFISDAAKDPINEKSHAYRLLQAYVETKKKAIRAGLTFSSTRLFSYNYTPLLKLIHKIDNNAKVSYTPVHGRTDDKSIIFGFLDDPKVPKEYRSLQKSMDTNYRSNDIVTESLKANYIIFFGLSLGYIDGVYFKNLFRQISNLSDPHMINKHLFFITKDKKSEQSIKNNLLDMDINLQLLYSSNEVRFIYTEDIEGIQSEEAYSKLIKKILEN